MRGCQEVNEAGFIFSVALAHQRPQRLKQSPWQEHHTGETEHSEGTPIRCMQRA